MKLLKFTLLLGIVCLLMGCAAAARYNFDKGTDFSNVKTYDWVPVSADPDIPIANIDFVKNEVDNRLSRNGFKITTEDPDFLIAASMEPKKGLRASNFGNRLTPQQIEKISYNEGSLILIFLDGTTKAKIWWGGARADLGKNMEQKKKEERVKKAIKELLKNFPPVLEE
jgi:hypothetical protein